MHGQRFSPSADVSSAAGEPVGGATPPQGLTAATPFVQSRDTFVPDGAERLSKQIPPAPPTVLTTPFSVDPLKLPSVQAGEGSPTLSRRIGLELLAASRNVSRATTAAIPGECVPTSGTEIAAPAGQYLVGCRTGKTVPPDIRSARNAPSTRSRRANCRHVQCYPRILHVNCCVLLAASLLLLAMDILPVHGGRYFLFMRGAVFRSRKKLPLR